MVACKPYYEKATNQKGKAYDKPYCPVVNECIAKELKAEPAQFLNPNERAYDSAVASTTSHADTSSIAATTTSMPNHVEGRSNLSPERTETTETSFGDY